jgi:microcompartment protein CcmL/EutN
MSDLPAIALIEFGSIAAGAFAADAMVKEAPIHVLRVGTAQPGKFLVLVGGGTAEVELAHAAGVRAGSPHVLDDVFLPDVHQQVADGIGGARREDGYDTLTILETSTVAAIIRACDAAIKGAEVNLKEIRLADGLGGKGIAVLTGERTDVEAAVEIAARALAGRSGTMCHSIVSRIDDALAGELGKSTWFAR